MSITWEKATEEKFNLLINKVPGAMQGIAETRISKAAMRIVEEDGRTEITEKDMVDAFFAETPFGFHGPMKTDMESTGIDYKQYGHE